MAEDWELELLERRLEGRIEALETENRKRRERQERWIEMIWCAVFVALWTVIITLAATGNLHHH